MQQNKSSKFCFVVPEDLIEDMKDEVIKQTGSDRNVSDVYRKLTELYLSNPDIVDDEAIQRYEIKKLWRGIKGRCYSKSNSSYKYYGGSDIGMYEKWINNPDAFIDYILTILGPKKGKEYSLDRIDVKSDYEPGNLKWSDHTQQARNRSNNVKMIYNGQEMCMSELEQLTGINRTVIEYRVSNMGMSIEEAVNRGPGIRKVSIDGTIYDDPKKASVSIGVSVSTIYRRINSQKEKYAGYFRVE